MSGRSPSLVGSRLAALDRPEHRATREELILVSLGDPQASVREVAVAWAARCLEPAALMPLVADTADDLRRNAALAALERQGPYAVDCVEQMTGDRDPDVAMFACQVLGSIGGPRSSVPLLAALGRPEINVVQAAAEALGRLQARDAVPALVALLTREPWLQLAAVDALGSIGAPEAAAPLLDLVPESFIAEPALDALRRIGAPAGLPKLMPLLLDPAHHQLRPALLGAIGAALTTAPSTAEVLAAGRTIERDRAPGGLWWFVAESLGEGEHDPPQPGRVDDRGSSRGGSTRTRAAGALVLAAGMTSLLPLVVRWGADRDALVWVRPLMEHYAPQLRVALPGLLAHPEQAVRAGAIRALPAVVTGLDALLAALDDPESAVRIAATDMLGALGDASAALPIARGLDSPNAAERAAACGALSRLPHEALKPVLAPRLAAEASESSTLSALAVLAAGHVPGFEERVYDLCESRQREVRRGALRAAALCPGSKAEVLLLRALADRDPDLQAEALTLLSSRGGDRVLTTLLAMLGVADSLRYHVIRALGRLGAARAAPAMEALFANAPLHERLEILTALARIGGERARPFLVQCLSNPQAEIRRAAAQGLAELADPEDLALLEQLATDADWALRGEAARALGRLGLPAAHSVLLDLARDLEPAVARTARAALAGRP